MNPTELQPQVEQRWPGRVRATVGPDGTSCQIEPGLDLLAEVCGWLFGIWGYTFGGSFIEETETEWALRHIFYGDRGAGWAHVLARRPLAEKRFPNISRVVHAADWHEREAEDMFGLVFEGHPRLGDFILHDDVWPEGVEPMRRRFSAQTPAPERRLDWRPRRIVEAPGAFAMPIGPVFSGLAESVHFQLETVGEDVIRAIPRLFYKYRGIEKIAEGRSVEDALLLAERFSATTAFAHALAFCQAVETLSCVEVPDRARTLRVFLSELERFRHHVAGIEGICESTALAVAASQMAILEEDLLRISGALTGHRYLFGLAIPGGLAKDLNTAACRRALQESQDVLRRLDGLEKMLRFSSSFLDRLEEVGAITERDGRAYGLVGPVARASGLCRDLRIVQAYGGYERFEFDAPVEREGDGYARLRILFAEARQSVSLMAQAAGALTDGPVIAPVRFRSGAALGWVEAPRGAAFHWVRLDESGKIARYHIVPPSFANWHGFHLSVENFAFQDFPIILATMNLSVAENDR